MVKRLLWSVYMGYVMILSTMLQGTWKEERIVYGLGAEWTRKIRVSISASGDGFLALGSVRECNPSGNYIGFAACMKCVCNWNCWAMRWCSWLRHYATSRNVAGSISVGVIGVFY
jgi:hypothetical protein